MYVWLCLHSLCIGTVQGQLALLSLWVLSTELCVSLVRSAFLTCRTPSRLHFIFYFKELCWRVLALQVYVCHHAGFHVGLRIESEAWCFVLETVSGWPLLMYLKVCPWTPFPQTDWYPRYHQTWPGLACPVVCSEWFQAMHVGCSLC